MQPHRLALTVALVAPLAAACVAADPAVDLGDGPADPGDEPDPDPDAPAGPALACTGTYQVDSALDLQAAAVLPQTAYDAIDLLRRLRDEPARTLFDLAEGAGVPAVGTLRAALPDALESRLYGWIDGQLAGYLHDGAPIGAVIGEVLALAETSIGELRLASELTLDGEVAAHRLRAVVFALGGAEVSIDLDGAGGVLDLDAAAPLAVTPGAAGMSVAVGAHAFGLPFGELALTALDDVLRVRRGADLRGLVGQLVSCPRLAAEVASKCVWGVCVGHEAELRAICEGGLDALVAELRARVAAVRFDAIALDAGAARAVDDGGDGVADRLVDGVWQARIDAGQGPRRAPGTFTAAR